MTKQVYGLPVIVLLALLITSCKTDNTANSESVTQESPNIVILYVDDLGYGDVSAYGATRVVTPNIDRLAENGIRFTDAHTTSATCTPSRYSLLTGEHAFRGNAKILKGDAPLIIPKDQPTLPQLLKKAGYTSAVVGKWHLGLGDGSVDWNGDVKPGPLELGFDYSFLLPATGDRTPTVYLENHRVVNLSADDPLEVSYVEKIGDRPTGYENPELLRQHPADDSHDKTIVNGISRMGWMKGGKSAEWVDEEFHTVFTEKANEFIAKNSDRPFFLFFSFHDIHVPRLPNERFQGKTDMGPRGDAIVQMDWITGELVKQLSAQGIIDNTIIIFTSDNGGVVHDGYLDNAIEKLGDHKPNGVFSGGKYSAYEGGTRVPMILHYPDGAAPGVSDALVSQVDIYASAASLLDIPMASNEAIDSENHLDAFLDAGQVARSLLLEESPGTRSLRVGEWKYIRATNRKAGRKNKLRSIDRGLRPFSQLFDLRADPGEQNNIAEQYPERVQEMESIMLEIEAQTEATRD